jgi:hypothetical protein
MFLWLLLIGCVSNVVAVDYYISQRFGSDSNTGTSTDSPWQSFANLYPIMNSLAGSSTVNFCQGDFYSNSKIESRNTQSITWRSYTCDPAYANVQPVITPSIRISTSLIKPAPSMGSRVVAIDMSGIDMTNFQYVFVNDLQYIAARFPNLVNPLDTRGRVEEFFPFDIFWTGIDMQSTSTNQPDNYWTGATLYVRSFGFWYDSLPVVSHANGNLHLADPGIGYFKDDGNPGFPIIRGYLDMKKSENTELLDRPREFLYWPSQKLLLVYLIDDNTYQSVLAGLTSIYVATYDTWTMVTSGKHFVQNLAFKYAYGGIFSVDRTSTISIDSVTTTCVTTYGIVVQGDSQVANSIVDGPARIGIWSQGPRCYIGLNTVTNIGMIAGYYGSNQQGNGIVIEYDGTTVFGNRIKNCGYNGIQVAGNGGTTSHILSSNFISSVMNTLDDGSHLYTQGSGVYFYNNVMTGCTSNIVGSWLTNNPICSCMYADAGSDSITFDSNSCNVAVQCVHSNSGSAITIINNICYTPGLFLSWSPRDYVANNRIATHGTNGGWQNFLIRLFRYDGQDWQFTYFNNNTYYIPANPGGGIWQTQTRGDDTSRVDYFDQYLTGLHRVNSAYETISSFRLTEIETPEKPFPTLSYYSVAAQTSQPAVPYGSSSGVYRYVPSSSSSSSIIPSSSAISSSKSPSSSSSSPNVITPNPTSSSSPIILMPNPTSSSSSSRSQSSSAVVASSSPPKPSSSSSTGTSKWSSSTGTQNLTSEIVRFKRIYKLQTTTALLLMSVTVCLICVTISTCFYMLYTNAYPPEIDI